MKTLKNPSTANEKPAFPNGKGGWMKRADGVAAAAFIAASALP